VSSHFSETVFTNSFVSNFSARTVKEEDRCVTTVCCLTFFLEKEREKLRERMFVGECVCLCEKKTPSRDRIRRKKRDQRDRRDVKRTAAARLTDIYAEREREQKKYLSFSPRFQIQKDQKKISLAPGTNEPSSSPAKSSRLAGKRTFSRIFWRMALSPSRAVGK